MTLLVALSASRVQIFAHLCFESFSEHLPRSGSGDLVEVAQTLSAAGLVMV
jgi:hypothetical protein